MLYCNRGVAPEKNDNRGGGEQPLLLTFVQLVILGSWRRYILAFSQYVMCSPIDCTTRCDMFTTN